MWMGVTQFHGGAAYFIGDPSIYDENKMSNSKHAFIKDGLLYWRVNGVRWFTNLDIKKRHEPLILYKRYKGHEDEYPHYDNYDAINVDKVSNIPEDYDGVMGVPISFLDKYCPEQFEIVGGTANGQVPTSIKIGNFKTWNNPIYHDKKIYQRILIRKTTYESNERGDLSI